MCVREWLAPSRGARCHCHDPVVWFVASLLPAPGSFILRAAHMTCFPSLTSQLRVPPIKFSYLLFNNASLFGRFHGCYLPRYLFVG